MPKGEIPRYENGLINFDELARYFPPRRKIAPFGIFEDKEWKNHHAYYLRSLWTQPHLPKDQRNQLRIDFRARRYNRLMLLHDDEQKIHNDFEEVDPDKIKTTATEASLRDFEVFDLLGAASLGINLTKNPRRKYQTKTNITNPSVRTISRTDRLAFFVSKRDEALRRLETPEITPEGVVTSIILRYSEHLRDAYLGNVAKERMSGPNIAHPFDLPPHEKLQNEATGLLKQTFLPEIDEGMELEEAA